jgi:hypothetical protein
MWTLAFGLAGAVLILVLRGRHDQRAIAREWQMVLAPWGAEVYEELQHRANAEASMLASAYNLATKAMETGSHEQAMRFLDAGVRVVERTSPDWVTVLRRMGIVSRMAAAVAPIPPLRSSDYRVPAIWGWATAGSVLHYLLASTAERFRLRAYVLRQGFAAATRTLVKGKAQLRPGDDWRRLDAAREDLHRLSTESLATFHALLLSLTAERR